MTSAANVDSTENSIPNKAISTPIDGVIIMLANRIGGSKSKEVERFLKFAVTGILGAVIDFLTLNILQATVLPPEDDIHVVIATTIAFIAAVTSNFIWNRFWTYPDSRSRPIHNQLSQFFIVSFIGWLGRTFWIRITYIFWGGVTASFLINLKPELVLDEITTNRIGSNVAQLIAIFIVMIWNFTANRLWTYNDVD